jgi:hypothetical protein
MTTETVAGVLLAGLVLLVLWRVVLLLLLAAVVTVFALGLQGVWEVLNR